MPNFNFRCEPCNLLFEKFCRDVNTKSYPCPSCDLEASKTVSTFGFVFSTAQTEGWTGVDSVDSVIDKGVGRDADKRWEAIKDRESEKRKLKQQTPHIGVDVVTGEYITHTNKEVEYSRSFKKTYNEIYSDHVKQREAEGIPKFTDDLKK